MAASLRNLNPFSWASSSTSTNVPPPVQHHEDLTYIFERIYKYLHKLNTEELHTLRSILTIHKVDTDHEIMKAINSKVKDSAQLTLKTSKNTLQKILTSPPTKITAPHVEDDTSFVDDGSLPVDEIKKQLAQKGDKLTKFTVSRWEFDAEYFTYLVDKCPHLQEVQLGKNYLYWKPIVGLNDKSLEPIANLKELKSLKMKFEGESYSTAQVTNLLAQPNLQQNLRKLELPKGVQPNYGYIAAIQKYQNLKRLILPSYDVSSISALLNAPSLVKTVESLKYHGRLNDSICIALGKYKNLTSLHMHCLKWDKQYSASLAQGLAALTKLEKLTIKKIPVYDDIAGSLEHCTNLKNVSINDIFVSPIGGLKPLLKNKDKLETLDLRGLNLIDGCDELYKLKALTSLRLEFKSIDVFGLFKEDGGLREESLRILAETYKDQLEELTLCANKMEWQSDTYIDAFANFTKLKKLIISGCRPVNDHSIRKLSSGPLTDTLEHLELRKVSISDAAIDCLAEFKKLKRLLITNCLGITEKGRLSFIQNEKLQNRLEALALGTFSLTNEMAFDIIKKFNVLRDLTLYNSFGFHSEPDVERKLIEMAKEKVPQIRLYLSAWQYRRVEYQDYHINFGYPFGLIQPDYV